MTLENTIDALRVLNDALVAALDQNDLDRCAELIEQRQRALQRFARACAAADERQRQRYGAALRELGAQDQALRDRFQSALDTAGQDLGQLGVPRRTVATTSASYVDRKA